MGLNQVDKLQHDPGIVWWDGWVSGLLVGGYCVGWLALITLVYSKIDSNLVFGQPGNDSGSSYGTSWETDTGP